MEMRVISDKSEQRIVVNALGPHIDSLAVQGSLPEIILAYHDYYFMALRLTQTDLPKVHTGNGITLGSPYFKDVCMLAEYGGDDFISRAFFEFYAKSTKRAYGFVGDIEVAAIPASSKTLEQTLQCGELVGEQQGPPPYKLILVGDVKVRVYASPISGGVTKRVSPNTPLTKFIP